MRKSRIIKIVSFIIILFVLFQLVPAASDLAVSHTSHTQNSKVFLTSEVYHTDVLLTGRENQNTTIHKAQFNSIYNCIPQISFEDFSAAQFTFHETPFDFRRVIRQSNQNYFNGSKYKNSHFVV